MSAILVKKSGVWSRFRATATDVLGRVAATAQLQGAGRLRALKPTVETGRDQYRPDIDGLRAIAVLAVLGYHLQVSWFRGGFVGVDIFFVISGYLIGKVVIGECRAARFSLKTFYARRVRRIIPAYLAMAFAVIIVSFSWLLPYEYVRVAWSSLFSALSASNIYFVQHTNYFDAPATAQPLLHTWSLAVEEQFYLLFPLSVLVICTYVPRHLTLAIGIACGISFCWGSYETLAAANHAFYLAPGRAWELLAGTLIVSSPSSFNMSVLVRNLIAALGLAMIAAAILSYSYETPFPGVAALLPCAGAALIIFAGQYGGSAVSWILSLKPVVFVGLISYSLYLWHWPLIYLYRFDSLVLPTPRKPLIAAISFAVAVLSWKFIEQPFRTKFRGIPNWRMISCGASGLAMLAVAASVVIATGGFPNRFSPAARAYGAYLDYGQAHFRPGKCFLEPPSRLADFDQSACLRLSTSQPNYLIVGDSHAAQLYYGLEQRLTSVNLLQATVAGCKPRLEPNSHIDGLCISLMHFIFSDFLAKHHVDRLLIAGRWGEGDLAQLAQVLAWARNRSIPVTVFGPMTEYDYALPRILAESAEQHQPGLAVAHQVRRDTSLESELQKIALGNHADYVSLYDLLCGPSHVCPVLAQDGSPLQFDTNHLTRQGSLLVAQKLIQARQIGS